MEIWLLCQVPVAFCQLFVTVAIFGQCFWLRLFLSQTYFTLFALLTCWVSTLMSNTQRNKYKFFIILQIKQKIYFLKALKTDNVSSLRLSWGKACIILNSGVLLCTSICFTRNREILTYEELCTETIYSDSTTDIYVISVIIQSANSYTINHKLVTLNFSEIITRGILCWY